MVLWFIARLLGRGDGERRRRYILCLNGEEAERQKWRRAALLETLEAELAALKADHPKRACRLLSSRRFAPYLSQDENGRPYIDRDKVKRAAESTTALTWRQLHDLLAPIKAVRYTAEGRTIVQAGKIRPEAKGVLRKLAISTPKTILDVA